MFDHYQDRRRHVPLNVFVPFPLTRLRQVNDGPLLYTQHRNSSSLLYMQVVAIPASWSVIDIPQVQRNERQKIQPVQYDPDCATPKQQKMSGAEYSSPASKKKFRYVCRSRQIQALFFLRLLLLFAVVVEDNNNKNNKKHSKQLFASAPSVF